MSYGWILVIWVAILVMAFPYVSRIKHPDQRPLAAYLIFITLFTAALFLLFNLLVWLWSRLAPGMPLDHPLSVAVILLLAVIPSLLLARWQTRKPPIRRMPP